MEQETENPVRERHREREYREGGEEASHCHYREGERDCDGGESRTECCLHNQLKNPPTRTWPKRFWAQLGFWYSHDPRRETPSTPPPEGHDHSHGNPASVSSSLSLSSFFFIIFFLGFLEFVLKLSQTTTKGMINRLYSNRGVF